MDLARGLLVSLVCCFGASCGGEPTRATAPRPEPDERAPRGPSPADPGPTAAPAAALRPPPGAPTVDGPRMTLWTDPARGLVLRAERTPGPATHPEEEGWGEVTVIARDRNAPGHLVRMWAGDLYWVEYRRADARCDFLHLADGASTPEILFEDTLGDFSETICDTAIAVHATGSHLFWVHGSEIRAVAPTRGARPSVIARGQPYPRELATDADHVYWLALGGDPYQDDLTGRGSLRAAPIAGGPVRVLGEGLTEPHGLVITGTHVELREVDEQVRRFLLAGPPVTPG